MITTYYNRFQDCVVMVVVLALVHSIHNAGVLSLRHPQHGLPHLQVRQEKSRKIVVISIIFPFHSIYNFLIIFLTH